MQQLTHGHKAQGSRATKVRLDHCHHTSTAPPPPRRNAGLWYVCTCGRQYKAQKESPPPPAPRLREQILKALKMTETPPPVLLTRALLTVTLRRHGNRWQDSDQHPQNIDPGPEPTNT